MDFHGQFRRTAIEQGIPEDEVNHFDSNVLRFQICANERPEGVLVGRRGGPPRLTAGMEWPSTSGGVPLPFIASLDCAALPRADGLALPRDGSLLFFLEIYSAIEARSVAEEQEFAHVVYVPDGVEAAVVEQPPGHREDSVVWEHDLFASVQAEVPGWLEEDEFEDWRSDFKKQLLPELPHDKELRDLAYRLWPARKWTEKNVYLGGYSIEAGNLPEDLLAEENLQAREKAGEPVPEREFRLAEEELQMMREWVPLAQFRVPPDYFSFGRFLIRHNDLAGGRFDDAMSFAVFTT